MDIPGASLYLLIFMVFNSRECKGEEAIYSRTVDGISFGVISPLDQPPHIEDVVWNMEEDIVERGAFILADGSSLKSFIFNADSNRLIERQTLIGNSSSRSYREGTYPEAEFNVITGFVQVNWTHILIVDSNNHCLRFLDRSTNRTSSYAGDCESSGDRDGLATASRFSYPRQAVTQFDHIHIFVSDLNNRKIKEINLSNQMVTDWLTLAETPIAVFLNRRDDILFVTTPSTVLMVSVSTKVADPLIRSNRIGFKDGSFVTAELNHPQDIQSLTKDVILMTETANNRLRVLNMKSATVSSICVGEAGFSETALGGSECKINQPLSLAISKYLGFILIGTNSTEMRYMKFSNVNTKQGSNSKNGRRRTRDPEETTETATAIIEPGSREPESLVVVVAVITAGIVVIAIIVSIVAILFRKYKAHRQRRVPPTANLDMAVANAMKHDTSSGYTKPHGGVGRKSSNHYDDYTEVEETYQELNYNEIENYPSLGTVDEEVYFNNGKLSDKRTDQQFSGRENQSITSNNLRVPPTLQKDDFGYLEFSSEHSTHENMGIGPID